MRIEFFKNSCGAELTDHNNGQKNYESIVATTVIDDVSVNSIT